ncbi:MAG: type II CAAX endopeptidase family protein [Erysipelotrichaceae bacterium]|nr:type II CAAX endopeptidase family protein [Erysipelotrichaceae bacterium]
MYQFNQTKSPLSIKRSLLILTNYFFGYLYLYPLIMVWFSEHILHSYEYLMVLQLIVYIGVFIVTLILARPLFDESGYNGVNNRRDNFAYAVKSIFMMYGCMIVMNIILNLVTNQLGSQNQLDVISMTDSFPLITFIMAVLLAPLIEEVVFRGVIFRKLRDINYPIAQIVSSLAFGFVHVSSSFFSGNYIDSLYIFVYAMLGYFLGLNYERSGTIYISIGLHTVINLVSMIMLLLTKLAGY